MHNTYIIDASWKTWLFRYYIVYRGKTKILIIEYFKKEKKNKSIKFISKLIIFQ